MSNDTVVVAISTLIAAVIGALVAAFFQKPPRQSKPILLFDAFEHEANISEIGLPFEDKAPQSKILVKGFTVENVSSDNVTDLIVEYRNLRKKTEQFHTSNDPSGGLLESYYEVGFNEPRESLRYSFSNFPPGERFTGVLTVNDFWIPGRFQANSQMADIRGREAHASAGSRAADRRISKWKSLYGATVVAFVLLISFLLSRG